MRIQPKDQRKPVSLQKIVSNIIQNTPGTGTGSGSSTLSVSQGSVIIDDDFEFTGLKTLHKITTGNIDITGIVSLDVMEDTVEYVFRKMDDGLGEVILNDALGDRLYTIVAVTETVVFSKYNDELLITFK